MSWNYRVFKETIDGEDFYTIREAYYKPGCHDKPESWTEKAVDVSGISLEDLAMQLEQMKVALGKEILTDEED